MSKKRRQYSAEFKLETVMEGIHGEKPVTQICRERNITDSWYYKWRDQVKEHVPEIFMRQDQQTQAVSELEAQIAALERMVGKLAMENEILKKSNALAGWSIVEKRAMIDQLKDEYPVRQRRETLECPVVFKN